jgi:alpha-glucosidase
MSPLHLHRRLLALRRSEPALSVGAWSPLTAEGDLLGYERSHAGRRIAVVLNLGHGPLAADLPAAGRILLSTHLDRDGEAVAGRVELRRTGVVVEVNG